jgi:hypothetical protein
VVGPHRPSDPRQKYNKNAAGSFRGNIELATNPQEGGGPSVSARAELRILYRKRPSVADFRQFIGRRLTWVKVRIDRFAELRFPDPEDYELRLDYQNALVWAGVSRQHSQVTITLEGHYLIVGIDHDSVSVVAADAQSLLKEFAFSPSRWSDTRYVEFVVESNHVEVVRMDGGAEAFGPLFKSHLVTTGLASTLANLLMPLATEKWSWAALGWGLVSAGIISAVAAFQGARTVEEVALRGKH